MGEGNENSVYSSPWDFKTSLTCLKILRHGTSGFASYPMEGVMRIFIALKIPSPRLGSNPRPLGLVASTLITTPLRRLKWVYFVIAVSVRQETRPCRLEQKAIKTEVRRSLHLNGLCGPRFKSESKTR
jgi:hypothetical protein